MCKKTNFFFGLIIIALLASCKSATKDEPTPVVPVVKKYVFADVSKVFTKYNCIICHDGTDKNADSSMVNSSLYDNVMIWVDADTLKTNYKKTKLYISFTPEPTTAAKMNMLLNVPDITKEDIAVINAWLEQGAIEK